MNGIINLNKPAKMSSARVVTRVKYMLPKGVKIGHAGTLDPFATGVLLVLVGKATKLCETLMGQPKQYETTIKLGATTETLDPESPERVTEGAAPLPREAVEAVLPRFVGEIEQMPPVYSALKISGRPAYELARKGREVALEARRVRVYGLELLDYHWPELQLRMDCGRGTYVRSLARDIGEALGVGGYVRALRRTRVGEHTIEKAVTLEQLAAEGVDRHILAIQ